MVRPADFAALLLSTGGKRPCTMTCSEPGVYSGEPSWYCSPRPFPFLIKHVWASMSCSRSGTPGCLLTRMPAHACKDVVDRISRSNQVYSGTLHPHEVSRSLKTLVAMPTNFMIHSHQKGRITLVSTSSMQRCISRAPSNTLDAIYENR